MSNKMMKLLVVLSALLAMVFGAVLTTSAQTTTLPSGCSINEVGDSFIEVFCLNAPTGDLSITGTAEARGTYTVTAPAAGGYALAASVPAGLLADAAGDGLQLVLSETGVVGSSSVVFTAAELDTFAATAATALTECSLSRQPLSGPFVARNSTAGAENTGNTSVCDGSDALAVSLSGSGTNAMTFAAVIVAVFAVLGLGTVAAKRNNA